MVVRKNITRYKNQKYTKNNRQKQARKTSSSTSRHGAEGAPSPRALRAATITISNEKDISVDPNIGRRETPSSQHSKTSEADHAPDPGLPSSPTSRTAQAPAEAAPLATEAGQSKDAEEEDHHLQNHQKRITEHRRLLPSLPQPAREAQTGNCARRKPPQPPRPQGRNGEGRGRTTPRNADSTATVLDAASRALTPNLHLTSRRRRTGVPPLWRGGERELAFLSPATEASERKALYNAKSPAVKILYGLGKKLLYDIIIQHIFSLGGKKYLNAHIYLCYGLTMCLLDVHLGISTGSTWSDHAS